MKPNARNTGKTKPTHLKKVRTGLALPPWLLAELDALPGSRAILIEEACTNYYRLQPPTS